MEKIDLGNGTQGSGDNGLVGGGKINDNFIAIVEAVLGATLWTASNSETLDLTSLSTTNKTSILAAINETVERTRLIDDSLSTSLFKTWSIDKLKTEFVDHSELDSAIATSAYGIKYSWADAAARVAETGMEALEQGVQQDTRTVYSYNGSAWVEFYTLDPLNWDDRYYTETESDAKYLKNITDTLDGDFTATGAGTFGGLLSANNGFYTKDLNIGGLITYKFENETTAIGSESQILLISGGNTSRGSYIRNKNISAAGQPSQLSLGTNIAYGTPIDRVIIDPDGTVNVLNNLDVTGTATATQFISNVAIGTSPLTVVSTTKVANLNADLLDGLDSTDFVRKTGSVPQTITGAKTFSAKTIFSDQIQQGTSTSSNTRAMAFGFNTISSGLSSVSFGDQTTASGDASLALGSFNIASGLSSFAAGYFNYARAKYETALGMFGTDYTPTDTTSDRIFSVGNGTDASTRSDALVITRKGDCILNGDFTNNGNISLEDGSGYFISSDGSTGGTAVDLDMSTVDTITFKDGI